jgi:hypothetical protein
MVEIPWQMLFCKLFQSVGICFIHFSIVGKFKRHCTKQIHSHSRQTKNICCKISTIYEELLPTVNKKVRAGILSACNQKAIFLASAVALGHCY